VFAGVREEGEERAAEQGCHGDALHVVGDVAGEEVDDFAMECGWGHGSGYADAGGREMGNGVMVVEEGVEPCGGFLRGEPADGVGDLAEFAVEGVAVVMGEAWGGP
jgi:hypothetical protein